MEGKELDYFLKAQHKLHSVLIRIYEDASFSNLIKIYGGIADFEETNKFPLNMKDSTFDTVKNISLFDDGQFLLGYVKNEANNNALLIGPIRGGELTETDITEIMSRYNLPTMLKKPISSFLYSTPIIPIEHFITLLSVFNLTINGKIVTVQQILQDNSNITFKEDEFIETAYVEAPHSNGEYENALWYYIKNGLVSDIENLNSENYQGYVGNLGSNQLRSLKNLIITLNSLCVRAAISGGLDTETAYTLSDKYVQRIENATSIPELGRLTPIIRKDYCQRVKNLTAPKIDNLYIMKVTEYVQKNIYAKISVTEIAEAVNISPVYLSTLSKQYLNCTLPQYINKQKVAEAKKLLRFTDKSLAEIATLLAFSSQSHFQNQFKKIRGITPAEYREKYKKAPIGFN